MQSNQLLKFNRLSESTAKQVAVHDELKTFQIEVDPASTRQTMCEEGQEENRAYESNERTQGEQRRGIVAQSSFEDPSKERPQPLHDTALFLREQR